LRSSWAEEYGKLDQRVRDGCLNWESVLTSHRAEVGLRKHVEEKGFINCRQHVFGTFEGDGELSKYNILIAALEQSISGAVSKSDAGTLQTQHDIRRIADGMRAALKNRLEVGAAHCWICVQNPCLNGVPGYRVGCNVSRDGGQVSHQIFPSNWSTP
jgi:hypothetical protein